MSEAKEQMLLVEKCRQYDWKLRQAGLPESGVGRIFHIPNGGLRTKSEAAKLKAMGVVPGVSDLMVPVMKLDYSEGTFGSRLTDATGRLICRVVGGLWIEMKEGDGKLARAQDDWGSMIVQAGYAWVACWGHEDAWAKVCDYMGITE